MPTLTASEVRPLQGHPGEKVLLLRNRLGWTQRQLSTLSHVRIDTIRRVEQGFDIRPTTLQSLATALGTTLAYLYTPLE